MNKSLKRNLLILALSTPIFLTQRAEARWGSLADDAIRLVTKGDDAAALIGKGSRALCKALPFLYEKPIFTASKDDTQNITCPWEAQGNAIAIFLAALLAIAGIRHIQNLNK